MVVNGLRVNVMKNDLFKGCSAGGVSERYGSLILIGDGVEGCVEVDLDNPPENVVRLVSRKLFGDKVHRHVEPLDGCNCGGKKWYMMGGAFCWSSDSRFPNEYPLPIHDRHEN